jgi:hypothetical protein
MHLKPMMFGTAQQTTTRIIWASVLTGSWKKNTVIGCRHFVAVSKKNIRSLVGDDRQNVFRTIGQVSCFIFSTEDCNSDHSSPLQHLPFSVCSEPG